MIPRINTAVTQSSESLQGAQQKLSDLISRYLADYANDLVWDAKVDFKWVAEPDMSETLKPDRAFKRLTEGKKWVIPQSVLNELTHDAYVVVGKQLFYVEKAKNKITEIKISESRLSELKDYYDSDVSSLQRITEITGHTPNPMAVRDLDDTDPLQVQFSKHAMLALQESEELVKNLGKFSVEVARYMTEEKKPATQEEKELLQLQTDQLSSVLENVTAPNTTKSDKPPTFSEAGIKLVKEAGSAAISFIPGLNTLIKVLKPFQETIILSILAPYSVPVALYQDYVNNKWYFDIYNQAIDASLGARDFAIEKRDGILRPLLALSTHCAEMYKIAEQAKLPEEAKNQLEGIRKTLAALQAKTLLDPSGSQQLLQTSLANVSETLSGLVATYFTESNALSIQEKKQEAVVEESKPKETVSSVDKHLSVLLKSLLQQIKKESADLKDTLLKNKIKILEASLSHKDEAGYHIYLPESQETSISLNLKAISNTFLALEKLNQLYSSAEDPELRAKAIEYGKKAFENFSKINWDELDEEMSEENKQLIDAMLTEGMRIVTPTLKRIVDATHQVELENHLRYGSILEELHPLFETVENVFIDRGLSDGNPFGFDESLGKELNEKFKQASENKEKVAKAHEEVTRTLERLDWYLKWANEIPKQGSIRRARGLYLGGNVNYDLPTALEKNAMLLLKDLAKLRADNVLTTCLDAIDQFEDRLITDLSEAKQKELFNELENTGIHPELRKKLESQFTKKKENKGIVATLNQLAEEFKEANENTGDRWPPKELTGVYESIFDAREDLNDRLLDETKYQEAINQHKKMRTQLLKREGLVKLIDAVKEGKNDPDKNVLEKRKLAILLVNVMGKDKKIIENAHEITTEFIKDDENILDLIESASQIDPELRHTLTLEMTLAGYIDKGYIDKPDQHLVESDDPEVFRQDLINMLDRLEPKHVFEILGELKSQSKTRATLLIGFLDENRSVDKAFNRDDLIDLLVKRYQRADAENDLEIKSKIGLFLGKLVNSKPSLMKKIYSSPDTMVRDIIKKECLEKNTTSSRALYFEGLVSTLKFRFEDEFASYEDFVTANEAAILALHRAIYERSLVSNEEIIKLYKKSKLVSLDLSDEEILELYKKAELAFSNLSGDKIIQFYKENKPALFDLVDHLNGIKFSAGSDAKRKLTELDTVLSTYGTSILMEKSKNAVNSTTKTIRGIRETLEKNVKRIFSDYVNENKMWDPDDPSKVSPIRDTDPSSVNLSKNCILALHQAEKAGDQVAQLLDQLKNTRWKWKTVTQHGVKISKTLLKLSEHLENISKIAKETGADDAILTKLNELQDSIQALPARVLNSPMDAETLLAGTFEQLSNTMAEVIRPYTSFNRPAAPVLPENQYQARRAVAEPGVTAQGKVEWFFLLEPLRTGMIAAESLHTVVINYLEYQKEQGVPISEEEEKIIRDTAEAIKNAKPDANGYFVYQDDETPFSQSLKALYNVSWAINELPRGFTEHSGAAYAVTASTQAGRHALMLLTHFNKIQFSAMSEHTSTLVNNMMDSVLVYGRDKAFSLIAVKMGFSDINELTDSLHDTELQHHLRFGILSEPVRPLFYELEKIFYGRGLSTSANPFSYDPAFEEFLKQKMNESPEEKERYQDVLREYQKVRTEFAIDYLKREGINALIQAAREGEYNEKLNSEKIRQLAILIADINSTSREEALENPGKFVEDFIGENNQALIHDFIAKVTERDPSVGHSLIVEAMLAGHVDYSLVAIADFPDSENALINVLDRLEAKQVLSMMDDHTINERACVFLTLLNGEPLTIANLDKKLSSDHGFSKNDLVKNILKRYKALNKTLNGADMDSPDTLVKPERRLMNSLGLFLGRLARSDTDIAKAIFSDENARKIVQYECVNTSTGGNVRTDSALYYEAMVNAFQYHSAPEKQSIGNFIYNNQSIILQIYHEIHSKQSSAINEDEFLDLFKNNPMLFLSDIEKFIKDKISLGSDAENKLRQLASDFILCTDNTPARYELLKFQKEAYGSQYARFLELLTPDATVKFWELVRDDLYQKPKIMLDTLASRIDSMKKSMESLSPDEKSALEEKFDAFASLQKHRLEEVVGSHSSYFKSLAEMSGLTKAKKLIATTNDPRIARCRTTIHDMMSIEDEMNRQCQEWERRIDALQKQTVGSDLEFLKDNIQRIVSILEAYQSERLPGAGSSASAITRGLRGKKIEMVGRYIGEFRGLIHEIKEAPAENENDFCEDIGVRAVRLHEKLEAEHNTLRGFLGYQSGMLGGSVKQIGAVLNADPKLDQTVSLIGRIIESIKKSIGYVIPGMRKGSEEKQGLERKRSAAMFGSGKKEVRASADSKKTDKAQKGLKGRREQKK